MEIQQFIHKRFVVPVSRILTINYIEGKKKLVSRGSNPQICTMRVLKSVRQDTQNIYTLHSSGHQSMQMDNILQQNASLFSLLSGFNHLQLAKLGYCTPISCHFCPLNRIYTQECIFQNWKFWKFLISPSERSELGDTKSLLVGSGQVTQMFCQFAQA